MLNKLSAWLPRQVLLMVLGMSLLLAIAVLLYAARGEIRNHWVPRQVNRFYGPSINSTFDRVFTPLNGLIQPGIAIKKQTPPSDICTEAYFRNFSETVQCGLWAQGTIKATPLKQAQWLQNAPRLKQYLLNHGWQKDSFRYGNVDLDQVFSRENTITASDYVLSADKEQCGLEVMYDSLKYDNPPAASEPDLQLNALTIHENCNRDVKFFGGDYEP